MVQQMLITVIFVVLLAAHSLQSTEDFWKSMLEATKSDGDAVRFLNDGVLHSASAPSASHVTVSEQPEQIEAAPPTALTGTLRSQHHATDLSLQAHEDGSPRGRLVDFNLPIVPPEPLSLRQRKNILKLAQSLLTPWHKTAPMTHVFRGTGLELSPGFVVGFSEAKTLLRQYMPGFYFSPRSSVATSVELVPGEGGIYLKRSRDHQVFVYKHVPVEASTGYSILQLVGMLELGVRYRSAIGHFPKYIADGRGERAIGPDSFVTFSDIVPA